MENINSQSTSSIKMPPLSFNIIDSNNLDNSIISNNNYESSFFDFLKNISFLNWILIILILAFLGFNIFNYLAKGTEEIKSIFGDFFSKLFGGLIGTTGQTINVSAEGAKIGLETTSSIIEKSLTSLQNIIPSSTPSIPPTPSISISKSKGQAIEDIKNDVITESTLSKSLNSNYENKNEYNSNIAESSLSASGKHGWCYIGVDRGFRACAEVGVNDICNSGNIYPSREICMNPNLRP